MDGLQNAFKQPLYIELSVLPSPSCLLFSFQDDPSVCSISDPDFVIYSSVMSFYLPFLVTLLFYIRIYIILRQKQRKWILARQGCHCAKACYKQKVWPLSTLTRPFVPHLSILPTFLDRSACQASIYPVPVLPNAYILLHSFCPMQLLLVHISMLFLPISSNIVSL